MLIDLFLQQSETDGKSVCEQGCNFLLVLGDMARKSAMFGKILQEFWLIRWN